ncbi:MAG: hypothetical protein ACK2U9_12710 [Anaerolineae bacterium]
MRPAAVGAVFLAVGAAWSPAVAFDLPGDPAEALARLEAQLLASPAVSVDYIVRASGAFDSDLAGRLELAPDRLRLDGRGEFGDSPADLALTQTAERLAGSNGEAGFDLPAAPATEAALIVGLVRMGILHNLARLVAGRPPDHADGGAAEWVTVHDVAWEAVRNWDSGPARGLSFRIRVSGTDSGHATLWLSLADGLPTAREQTVRFPGGEMQVLERYPRFEVAAN